MKITKAMINACAAEMVDHDWLNEQWDKDVYLCYGCDRPVPENHRSANRESPEDTRETIRAFLRAALKDA